MVVVVPPEGSNSMQSERDEDFESLLVMEDGSTVLTYEEETVVHIPAQVLFY